MNGKMADDGLQTVLFLYIDGWMLGLFGGDDDMWLMTDHDSVDDHCGY